MGNPPGEDFFGSGQECHFGAGEEEGRDAGGLGTLQIAAFVVADVDHFGRGNGCGGKEALEDTGVGLVGADLAGDDHFLEVVPDSQALEDGEEAEVEVRGDKEAAVGAEEVEGGDGVVIELPGIGGGEVLIEIVKEVVEGGLGNFGGGGTAESVADDGAPPGAVVIGGRLALGLERGRQGLPRGAEGFGDRVTLQRDAVRSGDFRIGVANELAQVEQRSGGVQADAGGWWMRVPVHRNWVDGFIGGRRTGYSCGPKRKDLPAPSF